MIDPIGINLPKFDPNFYGSGSYYNQDYIILGWDIGFWPNYYECSNYNWILTNQFKEIDAYGGWHSNGEPDFGIFGH